MLQMIVDKESTNFMGIEKIFCADTNISPASSSRIKETCIESLILIFSETVAFIKTMPPNIITHFIRRRRKDTNIPEVFETIPDNWMATEPIHFENHSLRCQLCFQNLNC
ncbi:hypothetical protein TNCT_245811 [Trichonephila clavata]|uniref:Uncharacterized protein n=1 Tax=Trichonephila clavata TaxID=2740835 RepID=A0A8X6JWZ1_TRICU|nr:hypothetical protein TNCT_245811 [Trichonephila clavata]